MNLFAFLKRSLRGRVVLLVGLWMIAFGVILTISNLLGTQELSRQIFRERQHLAQALADNLDNIVRSNLVLFQDAALNARAAFEKGDLRPVKALLRELYLRSLFTEGVFVVDRTGKVLLREPSYPSGAEIGVSSPPSVLFFLETGRPGISNLVPDEKKLIYAVVPVRDWRGDLVGALGGEADPQSARFRSLVQPIQLGEGSYLDLVDGNGIVLFSTRPDRLYTESDHGRFLAGLIQRRSPVVGTCHGCHEEKGFREREREVIAFAPSMIAPWGVTIRQAEREAMAPALAMERRLLIIGALTIPLALLFAWGVARSVTKPLGVLGQAAGRIERGHLEDPIPALGEDEIGDLARSLDRMRQSLKSSLEAIAEGRRDLEKRVQERTRELESLYQELQRKEELRGGLLRKVITAQEEERKRIARELHDETSQALATVLLSMETSAGAVPAELRERLTQMRTLTNQTLEAVHRMIFDLRPSVLDDLGLASALRWAAETHLEPVGIDLSFEILGAERRLSPEIEITLFRIGQEAISNIAKHAEANSVRITVEFGAKVLCLRVMDDGQGFKPDEVSMLACGARGLGLLGMKERAALIGGALSISSEPGKGTEISVVAPVTES